MNRSHHELEQLLAMECQRRERLARRAPLLHALIAEVEKTLDLVDTDEKVEALETHLIVLDCMRESGEEITEAAYRRALQDLAKFVPRSNHVDTPSEAA